MTVWFMRQASGGPIRTGVNRLPRAICFASPAFPNRSRRRPFSGLVESGKLRLSDRLFGSGGILGTEYGRPPYRAHIDEITVEHLLTHTAGGWQNDEHDPMFSHPEFSHKELITWTLANQPLEFPPAVHYAYSNFGYCVLGRVVEKLAGQDYAGAVEGLILKPCGIAGMRIGGNTLNERAPNEVIYYDQDGNSAYDMNVRRMDSHGGWLATPTDLARFLVRVDGFPGKPDLLRPDTISVMTEASKANPGYAKGWCVNEQRNWWHMGSLPGTTTIMARTSGGFCWAALTNTRKNDSDLGKDLDHLMWDMVSEIHSWPTQFSHNICYILFVPPLPPRIGFDESMTSKCPKPAL